MNWRQFASSSRMLYALAALALVLLFAECMILALGGDLHAASATAWAGTWGTSYSAAQVVFRATTLLIVAVASEFALRAGVVSVAVEGQVGLACWVSAVVAVRFPVVGLLGAVVSGMLAAALLGAGIAWLYARRGVNVVLSGLLLNPLVAVLVSFGLAHGAGVHGTVRTASVSPDFRLARVDAWWHAAKGTSLSSAWVLAPLLLGFMCVYFARTVAGAETALVGLNPRACRAEGVPVERRVAQALLLSASVAALASLPLVFGGKGYFEDGMGAGLGFSGLAVAMMARGSAWRLGSIALGVATLEQAALACHAYLPRDAAGVLLALFLIALCAADAKKGRVQ